jgi:hypothetical protein
VKRSGIAAKMRDERMRAFMTRRGKKKHDVPDNSESDKIRGHGDARLERRRAIRKR